MISLAYVEDPWPAIGGGLLILVGLLLVGLAISYPGTTLEGERVAVSWRGYRTGLRNASDREDPRVDLDKAFPFIVAFALESDYHDRLEKASEEGYIPAWFQVADDYHRAGSNWFVYWVAFHGAMSPESGGAGITPGGAAAGSGGAGGRF